MDYMCSLQQLLIGYVLRDETGYNLEREFDYVRERLEC